MKYGAAPSGRRILRRHAFSLIEIMVAVTILSLMMIGLLAVFNHVQRALRMAHSQTDVFEGSRAVVDLLQRDLTEANVANDFNVPNIFASDVSIQTLPLTGGLQTNVVQDFFLLSRQNDTWSAFGYYIDQKAAGVGTLYRFATNGWWFGNGSNYGYSYFGTWWQSFRKDATNMVASHRIVDGVIHFQVLAFDEKGRLYTDRWSKIVVANTNLDAAYKTELTNNVSIAPDSFAFAGRFLPAYIEIEIGILEPQATRQFNAIAAQNPTAAQAFLQNQAGKIQLFRQRIPVRNHVKPEAID